MSTPAVRGGSDAPQSAVPDWHRLSSTPKPELKNAFNRRLETEALFPEKNDDKDY